MLTEKNTTVPEASDVSFDLKKHVAAIHSANKLSLVQRKIANALLFNAYNDLATKDEHQIHISALCDLIGYNSNEQRAIKNALISLISTVVEWNLVDKEKLDSSGVWNASAIISGASLDGAICTYSYSKTMRQLLHRPEMYGRLNMQVQAKFKSSYGIALYENCIRYQNINETPWFDMPTFRKLMGVDDEKYDAFKDFKKRVIDIAVKEVNQHSYITIDYLLKKAGRKTVAIKFNISMKNMEQALASPISEVLKQEFAFSSEQIKNTIERYDESYVIEKVNLIRDSKSFKSGKIHNLAKYLQSALAEDYQAPKSSKPEPQAEQADWVQQKQRRQEQDIRLEKDKRRQEEVLQEFDQLPENEKQEVLAGFQQVIKATIYESLYRKDQLTNAIVARRFTQFLQQSLLTEQ